jgi:hypothetical protein
VDLLSKGKLDEDRGGAGFYGSSATNMVLLEYNGVRKRSDDTTCISHSKSEEIVK